MIKGRQVMYLNKTMTSNQHLVLKAGIKTTVFEKSGNFSQDYATVDVNAYSGYVGIKVPES